MTRTEFQECMSRELKGNLAGKSKAQREKIFATAAKKCSGKSGKVAKISRSQTTTGKTITTKSGLKVTPRRTTTVTTTIRKRKHGPLEKKADEFKKELADIARALGVPVSKATIKTSRMSTTIRVGGIIRVKRKKLSDAMRDVRKKAKARI